MVDRRRNKKDNRDYKKNFIIFFPLKKTKVNEFETN